MKEKLLKLNKTYRIVNIVVLSICLYLLIFFPIVSKILERISPVLTRCPYLQITGKPCPLCGGTRFLQNMGNIFHDYHYVFNIFGLIVLIMILEIIFRIINLIKKESKPIIIKWDIIVHCILFVSYIAYVIYFISK